MDPQRFISVQPLREFRASVVSCLTLAKWTRMLHITNGDIAAELIRQSGVPGEVLPWRDVLHEGPVPNGLSLDAMSEVRAKFHAQPGEAVSFERVLGDFRKRDLTLKAGQSEDELVLWFEADLYDQLQIIQILDWLGRQVAPRISMICIGEFPGMPGFQGLGQLTGDQLAGLFPTRRVVGHAQLGLASCAWAAFTAPDPSALNRLTREDTASLEFLGSALLRLLAEYPLHNTGLGETERQVLRVLAAGPARFAPVFAVAQAMEPRPFMGDTALWGRIRALERAREPALTIDQSELRLTAFGLECLQGKADYLAVNEIDRWIGGVHLTENSPWRWDPRARQVGKVLTARP